MNVGELREAIKDLPDNVQVILQKDAEGNGYSPLEGADSSCVYEPDSSWSGEVKSTDWTADEAGVDEEEWEEILKKPRCLVLYPVN